MHLEYTRYALALARARIIYIGAGIQLTAIDAEVAQTSYIRVGCNLERQGAQGLILIRVAYYGLLSPGIRTFNLGGIHRAGQIGTNGIQHGLHTLVLETRTTNHREDMQTHGTLADSGANLFLGNRVGVGEILLHQHVVKLGASLEHLISPLNRLVHQVSSNRLFDILCAHGLVVPDDGFHLNQIHHTLESLFCTNRYLYRTGCRTQNLLNLAYYREEVRTAAVHLIHVAHAGYHIFIRLTPYGLALGLHAAYCAEGSHSTVQNAQRTLYLYREIHVTRSVNQIDFVLLALVGPIGSGSCRGNRDTTLLLLLHPVHRRSAIVHLAYLMGQTRVE